MKGNVLVLGNSGVGKSTLINAVLGTDVAAASFGTAGTTKELKIYGPDLEGSPFNLIDSVGFEPNWFKAWQAVNAVKAWSRKSAKEGNEDNQINIVWFCIDGCAAKLFPETVENMAKAVSMWKDIPVVVVITKSFSKPDRDRNITMIREAFDKVKKYHCNVQGIMPVVAQIYEIKNEDDKKRFTEILLEMGAATLIGKAAISAVKAIPGINLAADVINAIVAGAVVSLMGETVCYVLDRVYLGKLNLSEYDKVRDLVKEKFASGEITKYVESVAKIAEPILAKTKGKKAIK